MDFPREKLLEKYVQIYEKQIADYEPDFEVAGGTTRYLKFNEAIRELDPFEKSLISRLMNKKNTFPKKTSLKLPKNANPNDYFILRYDSDGILKTARLGKSGENEIAFVYVSKQLTIGYSLEADANGKMTSSLYNFEWYEYDDKDRLISSEIFRGSGSAKDDVIIDSEYYEYDGDVLSHVWYFKEFQKYPIQMTLNLVKQMMPDRIFYPEQFEYTFKRVEDGLDYTRNHYFRKSQTITDTGHVSEEILLNLADNGLRLI